MKKVFLFTVLLAFANGVFSQNFEVPKNYKFEKEEDYVSYEQDVINCVDWLINTPFDANSSKRKNVYSFLLAWATGCPYVHLEINTDVVTFFFRRLIVDISWRMDKVLIRVERF